MKHKYKSHKSIRKLKNKKHQILCSLKGNIRRCYSRNKNTRKKNSLSESRREIYLENYNAKVDDGVILERESWWKEILQTREFGYNDN